MLLSTEEPKKEATFCSSSFVPLLVSWISEKVRKDLDDILYEGPGVAKGPTIQILMAIGFGLGIF